MLDRRIFLQRYLNNFYTDERLSPYLKEYRYSEIKLWDFFIKSSDKELWSEFNLNGREFSLDISINYGNQVFFNVEIKHNENFYPKVLNQMYRKCAFLLSPYQAKKYRYNEFLFIAWSKKVDQKKFKKHEKEEYFILTEDFKKECAKGIMTKIKDKSSECLDGINDFIENDGIRLITWESIEIFIEKKILTMKGIDDSIQQSCSDFLINLKYRYAK